MAERDLADFRDGSQPVATKTRRMLNVRLLAASLGVLLLVAAGMMVWSEIQVRRIAVGLLAETSDLIRRNRFCDAADMLARFLELRPHWRYNPAVRYYRARIYDRGATDLPKKRTAMKLYEEAVKDAEPRDAVRLLHRLGELSLEVGDFTAAKQQARELLGKDENDPQGWRLLAIANHEQYRAGALTAADKDSESAAEAGMGAQAGQPATVGITLGHAHRLNPQDIEIADRLARVYRTAPALAGEPPLAADAAGQTPGPQAPAVKAPTVKAPTAEERRAKAADQIMAEMVASRPKDAAAQLALYRYLMIYTVRPPRPHAEPDPALRQARQAIADALVYRPDDPAVLLAAGDAARWEGGVAAHAGATDEARRRNAEARRYYERTIRFIAAGARGDPERAYVGLSETYVADGDIPDALDSLRRGFEHCGEQSIFLALCRVELLMDRSLESDLAEVAKILPIIDGLLQKAPAPVKSQYQPMAQMWRASLLVHGGKSDAATPLLTALTESQRSAAAADAGGPVTIPVKIVFQAWLLLGATRAERKQWDGALTALEAAAAHDRTSLLPALQAAAVCVAADRPAKARAYYEQALGILGSGDDETASQQRDFLYARLIALCDQEKRDSEARRWRALRNEQMARSAALTQQGIDQALQDQNPAEALAVAERGVGSRPQDPWAYVALGRAHRAAPNRPAAADAYQKALQLAQTKPETVIELAESLVASGDRDDQTAAETMLRSVAGQSTAAGLRLVEILVQRGEADGSLAIAQDAVSKHPKDPVAQVALGKAWWAKRELAKAKAAFQEGVRIAGDNTRPIRTLFNFYAGTGQADAARTTLEQIPLGPGASGVEQALFLANGYAGLGFRPLAKMAYQKAVGASMGDPAVVFRQAEFLLGSSESGDVAEGEKLLQGIAGVYAPARRTLVTHLVALGDEEHWQAAQAVFASVAGDRSARQDRLLCASALMDRGGVNNLAKAAGICRSLLAEGRELEPDLHLLLARICDRQGQAAESRRQYLARLGDDRPLDVQVAVDFTDLLIRAGSAEEADTWLRKLEKAAPDELRTVQLRASWLLRQHRTGEIEPLIEGFAQRLLARIKPGDAGEELRVCERIARLYGQLNQYAATERWARRLIKLAPGRFEHLAMALAFEGRVGESLALCNEAADRDATPRPAMTAACVLLSGRAVAADLKQAEPLLQKALDRHKNLPDLLANVLLARSLLAPQEAEATIARYREALKQWPTQATLLNNLAILLGEQSPPGKHKEALECIDRAIRLTGPRPILLDTKGVLLVRFGEPDRGVPILYDAVAAARPDAQHLLHLAIGCGRLGRRDEARQALARARKADLDPLSLTAGERAALADLEKKLEHQSP